MKKEPLESIASSFRAFVWVLAAPCLAFSILLIILICSYVHQQVEQKRLEKRQLESSKVFIADGDLPTGTVLTTNNVAVKTLPNADLKGDGISLDQFDVLLGHRLVVPRKQFEPIRWHDTDIVLTNRDTREQAFTNSVPSAESGRGSRGK